MGTDDYPRVPGAHGGWLLGEFGALKNKHGFFRQAPYFCSQANDGYRAGLERNRDCSTNRGIRSAIVYRKPQRSPKGD